MNKNDRYIKAKLKSQEQIQKIYPSAKYWGQPISLDNMFPSADECILPYLEKTLWIKKKRYDLLRFYYEVKDADGIVVSPDWIDYFESNQLVPPGKWKDPDGGPGNYLWLNPFEERWIIIEDLLIITG